MTVKIASQRATKKAILKAQEDLCAQMVSTAGRTAGLSKSCRGEDRQKALETRIEKNNIKALCTKYWTNPEVFDNEPDELLSDIDRDEDNMFADHSASAKPHALAFTTSKTPPTIWPRKTTSMNDAHSQKALAPAVSLGDDTSSDDCSDASIEHNDKVQGVGAPADSVNDQTSSQQSPFPEALMVETNLAKRAWWEASDNAGLTIQLTPALVKMMMRRTSHVCGELKTKMRGLTLLRTGVASPATVKRHRRSAGKFYNVQKEDKVKV
ncbi:hypothetical protein BDR07DRAFT_1493007 [Suillus spraguei]|nr:hypothetical protein BDR07DRAFT_1493007 [Suillus spraguei]